ncbi:MAG: hypothetical protein KAG94_05375 [Clostridiales bacterium]|nr:hypothetical protein [Clostridiales bacterium]
MKLYKKILIILVVFTLLVGCNNSSSIKTTNNTPLSLKSVSEFTINIGAFPEQNYFFDDEWKSDITSWQEEIKNKYGVDINLNYISSYYADEIINGIYYQEAILKDEISGLIKLSRGQIANIGEMINQSTIYPLDEYLENNQYYKNLPDVVKEPFIVNGVTYAIPAGSSYLPSVRLIRKDLLEKTGLNPPSTTTELYEILMAFKKNDGIVPIVVSDTYNVIANLKDILHAYGCYPSYNGNMAISYDPTTNAYEDYLLKPEAKEALLYINMLFDNNLLERKNVDNFDDFIKEDNYGSYYSTIYNFSDTYQKNYDIVWHLSGSNNQYLMEARADYAAYVLTINTKNPQEVINTFIDTLFVTRDKYLMGYFGQEGVNYIDNGDVIKRIEDKHRMQLLEYNSYYQNNETTLLLSNGDRLYENMDMLNNVTDQLLADHLAFVSPLFPYYPKFVEVGRIHSWFLNNFILRSGDTNVDNLIEAYVRYAKIYGGPEALEYLNDLYNTKPKYTY